MCTHGGWIMEMYNFVNMVSSGEPPKFANSAKNCSLHILQMYCKKTKRFCNKSCPDDNSCMMFKIVMKNDDSHVTVH